MCAPRSPVPRPSASTNTRSLDTYQPSPLPSAPRCRRLWSPSLLSHSFLLTRAPFVVAPLPVGGRVLLLLASDDFQVHQVKPLSFSSLLGTCFRFSRGNSKQRRIFIPENTQAAFFLDIKSPLTQLSIRIGLRNGRLARAVIRRYTSRDVREMSDCERARCDSKNRTYFNRS